MVERTSTAFEKLTPREREILRLIAAHLQSKEIARALGLSPKTVEMHVLSARRRLAGMSRRDAALAFVAWETQDPGNDYRRQPDGMVALQDPPLPGTEHGSGDDPSVRPDVRPIKRDWRHEMNSLQWTGMVLGMTAVTAVALAVAAAGVHQLMLAVERITGR